MRRSTIFSYDSNVGALKYALIGTAVIAVLWLILAPTTCVDAERTRSTLQEAGYHDIEIGGYKWLGCTGRDDAYETMFSAFNSDGRHINGVVCCGVISDTCTIRY